MHIHNHETAKAEDLICGFDRRLFLQKYPMLAPAIDELNAGLYGIRKRDALDLFLLSFCRLFEKEVSEDRDEAVPYAMTAKIINRMLETGHTVMIDKTPRSLAVLFHAAAREAGAMAPILRQAVATMYARRYAVN